MPIHHNHHSRIIDALLYIRTEAIKAKLDADRDELCNAFIRPCPTQGLVDELITNGLLELSKDNTIQLTDAGTAMLQASGNPSVFTDGERSDKERLHTDNMTLLNYILLGSGDYHEDYASATPEKAVTTGQLKVMRTLHHRFRSMITDGHTVKYAVKTLREDGWLEMVKREEPHD